MSKTPEYTKKAVAKYNAKFDRISLNLPKGTRDRIAAQGITASKFINSLVLTELDRLEQANRTQPEATGATASPNGRAKTETPEENAARLASLQAMVDAQKAAYKHGGSRNEV